MIILPTQKINASRKNPRKIILFGKPKIGKSTALANLDNCLILDLEGGTDYLEALKIDIIGEARKQDVEPIVALKQVINSIKEANIANNGFVYKYGAIDTISILEEMVLPVAKKLYQKTPMGRNFQGENVLELPNGAGRQIARTELIAGNSLESLKLQHS